MGTCGHGPEGHCGCSACRCCTPSDYIAMAGFSVITDEATAATYAIRMGSPTNTDAIFYPKTIIMSHRIAWWRVNPGDCGQANQINTPLLPKISSDIGVGTSVLGGASGVAALGGFSGLAGATAIAGPFAAVAAAVLLPLAFISENHAKAVAKETSMGCAASVSWNQFADAMEKSLQSGTIGEADARQYLDQAVSQIKSMIDSIAISNGDAGYMMRYGLLGLQQLYKDSEISRLAQKGQTQQILPSISTPVKIGLAIGAAFILGALLLE